MRFVPYAPMDRLLETVTPDLIIWIAVLAVLVVVAVYVVKKFRTETLQREPPASELLSKFREMHSRGELSDEEFRTIKTALSAQLQEELRDSDGTG